MKTGSSPDKILHVQSDAVIPARGECPCTIVNAWIEDSLLVVHVKYRTGARLHDFDLVTDGTLLKSLPPVVTLYLIEKSVTDRRYTWVNQELRFNVSPARQWAKNQVVFNLNGYPDPIIYRYEK